MHLAAIFRRFLALLLPVLMGVAAFAGDKKLTWPELGQLVPPRGFAAAELAGRTLIAECPPSECLIVSLGTASPVVDSFLRELAKSTNHSNPLPYVFEVPYRNIKYLATFDDHSAPYLEAMLPSPSIVADRKVVFYRSLFAAVSIEKVLKTLVKTFAKKYPRERIGAVFGFEDVFVQRLMLTLLPGSGVDGYKKLIIHPGFDSMVMRGLGPGRIWENPIEAYHRYQPVDVKKSCAKVTFTENPKHLELDELIGQYLREDMVFPELPSCGAAASGRR